jgi:hypothetical protein
MIMNKRIKELVKAAGGIGHDDDGQEMTPMLVGNSLEKFAKLIADDCASLCERFGESGDGYTCSSEIAKAYK